MLKIIKILMLKNQQQKIFIGLSGGVDSAVSAYLLKQKGYNVEAVFMQNWENDKSENCTSQQDLFDAKQVSEMLDIPFHVVNFSEEYWNEVFEQFLKSHSKGFTPNPDILCNSEIKFKHFLNYAIKNKANFIATGHYAAVVVKDEKYELRMPLDKNKDQTYFLHALNQHQLGKVIFPLADLKKNEVREIAMKLNLTVAEKKDSTGICFIGNKNYNKFISEYMISRPGEIYSTCGKLLGRHNGLMYYTIGQRKGIQVGGLNNFPEDPWYVVKKDLSTNRLFIAQGSDNKLLFKKEAICDSLSFVSGNIPQSEFRCQVKIRYRQQPQTCVVKQVNNNFRIIFDSPQRAVTPGQYAVFYENQTCLGGGIIIE
ncbi:MAG: tRNA 2-thiouridine(34) synthase MnmA [Pseudomonadota bacterium]|nr:tRNA 2-thiouridine(34) synthase MnmA [Pseudomonadota bacterium]